MAVLRDYEVEINGMTTTLRLSDADAKKRGLKVEAPAKASRSEKSGAKGGE